MTSREPGDTDDDLTGEGRCGYFEALNLWRTVCWSGRAAAVSDVHSAL